MQNISLLFVLQDSNHILLTWFARLLGSNLLLLPVIKVVQARCCHQLHFKATFL